MDDRESLDRIKSLLERASALPRDDRHELLQRECASDSQLRARIEELLGLHDAAGSFLHSGPGSPGDSMPESAEIGRRIGPYTLTAKIGEGGFGVVYLAQQHVPIQRNVALKLVRVGASTSQVLARFDAERQALALMDHPNIAVVHDAGVTPEGVPYFVMEYVDGVAITKYADDRKLGLEDRLRLFQQLCEAVQHAHQKGVIHRDLKPSNVLVAHVGERPVVKVIDFGVAKALGARLTEETLHTQAGVVIGTPEYMSPEQASAAASGVDTRSDVYSLGVILYELLVGAVPFERDTNQGSPVLDLLQQIREREPRKLTTRLDALGAAAAAEVAAQRRTDRHSLMRRLRGDLEWITLKALAKEPERRYASAATLAEDVGRHLANLPILARSPSTAYQLQKLASRHRGMVALGSVLIVALIGFAIAMSVMYSRQRTERLRAEHSSSFLRNMLASVDPANARGDQVLVRDLLDDAAARVGTDLAGEPLLQAEVMETIIDAYDGLGLPSEALALARARLDLVARLTGRESPEYAGGLRLYGSMLREAGQPDSGLAVLREANALLAGNRRAPQLEIARSKRALATALAETGQYDDAVSRYQEAMAIFEGSEGKGQEYASCLNDLAQTFENMGRNTDAEVAQREAIEIHRANLGADHPDVLVNMSNLAVLLRKQKKYAEAESLYRAVIEGERRVLGNDHPILAKGLSNLGLVLKTVGRYDEAESLYVESLAIRRRVLGPDHPDVAASLNNLAVLYGTLDRDADAENAYREALAIRRKVYGDRHPDVATVQHNLAGLLASHDKHEEAETLIREALATRLERVNETHPDIAKTRQTLVQILLERGQPAEARRVIEVSLAAQGKAAEVDEGLRAWSRNLLGQCILRQGDAAAAETLLVGTLDPILADPSLGAARKRGALEGAIEGLTALGKRDEAAHRRAQLDSLSSK